MQDELGKILESITRGLQLAVTDPSHAWRVGSLATSEPEGWPAVRQVVLREVGRDLAELMVFTDPRSPKWQQLQANARVEMLFWCPLRKVQLRCRALAVLHRGDERAAAYQATLPAHAAGDYASLHAPGDHLETSQEGQQRGEEWHFGVMALQLMSLDYLQLSREGHQRACFLTEKGGWSGRWIQP